MAGAAFGDAEGGKRAHLYEYKITSYFVYACMVAAMGGSLFGYDLGVSGGVTSMDDFLKKFFKDVYDRKQKHLKETDYCKYDNQILTLFTSSLYFAALVSTFGASYVTRNKGRRASILVGSVCFFAGAVMNAAAENIAMLIIGRILLGFGIGFGNQVSSPNIVAPNLTKENFKIILQLSLISYIHHFLLFLLLWLVRTGSSFVPFRNGTTNVEAEYQDLVEASELARAIKHPFRNLFERKNRPQLVIGALGIPAFQQLTGMNSILFYCPVIFQSLGFGSGASLYSSAITSSALVLATFISMALVDKFGRRAFFLEAGAEMICCMVAVAITLALKFGQGVVLPKGIGIFLVIVICIFVVAYGRSWGPLGWLVPSEIFPLETRSAGQSIVVCVNMIFTALVAQCFLVSLCHLKYGIFLLFGGLIVIMSCFVYFLLPETKQVPIEEIHFLWQNHWFWKRYCPPPNFQYLASQMSELQPSWVGKSNPPPVSDFLVSSLDPSSVLEGREGGRASNLSLSPH